MNFIRSSPVLLSALLLAAHFYRAGQAAVVAVSLVLPALLLFKRSWVPTVISVALILGAFEWIHTLLKIATIRADMGAPWLRMALILGTVALFTAGSAFVFRLSASKQRYANSRQ